VVSPAVSFLGRSSGRGEVQAADVVLTDAPEYVTGSPRAVVLTTPTLPEEPLHLPAGYRWSSEEVGGHQLTTGVAE
jgi:hypothetical protein